MSSPPITSSVERVPTGPIRAHLSFSQLDMYLRCSMQYYFRYVLDIIDPPKLATGMGHAGHAALEANAKRKIKTGADMPLEEVLDKFSDLYDNEMVKVEHFEPDEDPGAAKDEAAQALTVYRLKEAPKVLPVLVEYEFNLDLSTEGYDQPIRIVNGKIDLIDAYHGVTDYKFSLSRRPKSQETVDTSAQLTLYDMAYHQSTGKYAHSLGFVSFIPPGKDPARHPAEAKPVTRSPELLRPAARKARWDRVIHQMHTAERAIHAGIFMPTDNPITCSWCGYRDRCQSSLVKSDYLASTLRSQQEAP